MDNGYYRFYDGEASHSYVVGRCLENGEIIKSEQFDLSKMIEMNRDKYDYCIFDIRVAANAQNINQTFYRMVITNNNKNETEAAWFSYGNAILPSDTPIVVGLNMTQEERNCISDSDFKILNNEMKSHYKNSDGIVIKIVTEDGKIKTERREQY